MSNREKIEARLCDEMGYPYCSLFPRARDAIRPYLLEMNAHLTLPSNVCRELYEEFPDSGIDRINGETGLSDNSSVQLYGFRLVRKGHYHLELDPLMTGWMGEPFADSTVISFGYGKTIDIGAGGAFLTHDKSIYKQMRRRSYFPQGLELPLWRALEKLPQTVERKRELEEIWNRALGNLGIRTPLKPVIPWRHVRRFPRKRDMIVWNLRAKGFNAGTNYPPLPGYCEPSSVKWGQEVINLWTNDEREIWLIVDIIKETLDA